jgi:translation initiation factor 4G
VIELRENNWMPRKVARVEGPTTIQDLNTDEDILRPGLNMRNRDYRNNDRGDQRDWITKFSLNLQNLNDGFSSLSVSNTAPLIPPV